MTTSDRTTVYKDLILTKSSYLDKELMFSVGRWERFAGKKIHSFI